VTSNQYLPRSYNHFQKNFETGDFRTRFSSRFSINLLEAKATPLTGLQLAARRSHQTETPGA
jgi:hypothetical protein